MNPNIPNTSNNNKYKTVLCKHYGSGKMCVYGDKCQFAHGANEVSNVQVYILNKFID